MIEIRQLRELAEFAGVVELQQDIWGFDRYRPAADAISGGGRQSGRAGFRRLRRRTSWSAFCFAIPGVKPGRRPYLHSHMLGVLPEYRDCGIGRAAEAARSARKRSRAGSSLIEWTFDPLELKNAFFNIERLGAIVRRYAENQYGITASPLHGGLPTDRCTAEWWLDSPRVRGNSGGRASAGERRRAHFVSRRYRADSQPGRRPRARNSKNQRRAVSRRFCARPGGDRLRTRSRRREPTCWSHGNEDRARHPAADPHAAGALLRDQLRPHIRAPHHSGGGAGGRHFRLGRSHGRREPFLQRGMDRIGLADSARLRRPARAGPRDRRAARRFTR